MPAWFPLKMPLRRCTRRPSSVLGGGAGSVRDFKLLPAGLYLASQPALLAASALPGLGLDASSMLRARMISTPATKTRCWGPRFERARLSRAAKEPNEMAALAAEEHTQLRKHSLRAKAHSSIGASSGTA